MCCSWYTRCAAPLETTLNESFSVDSGRENEISNPLYENRTQSTVYGQPNVNQHDFYPLYVPPNVSANQKMTSTPNKYNPQDFGRVGVESKTVDVKSDPLNNYPSSQKPNPPSDSFSTLRGDCNGLKRSTIAEAFPLSNPSKLWIWIWRVYFWVVNLAIDFSYNEQPPQPQSLTKPASMYSQSTPYYARLANDGGAPIYPPPAYIIGQSTYNQYPKSQQNNTGDLTIRRDFF